VRVRDRATAAEKKRELGLIGDLRGRHLAPTVRTQILSWIEEARLAGETLETACEWLQLNPRAVYRWKAGTTSKPHHGGGGGRNRITPLEEKRVLTLVRKFPQLRCRRIAYQLERKSIVFIGKTKVSEIMKKHGLSHSFERGVKKELDIPGEMLLHEPWRKNLLWGTDWTYLKIDNKFWYLLLIIDWYSRKIVSWGLFPEITKFQVVAVITQAVAVEGVDNLPKDAMKPRIVADHGSANIAKYTKKNIEVQGLDLWLSGIGRPTGNARTERVMGTLKREEIKLQEQYASEDEARSRLKAAIGDYNFRRPNAGNGGFAPNSVHLQGRKILALRRKEARQHAQNRRRKHWDQIQSC
jgi:putative transposase